MRTFTVHHIALARYVVRDDAGVWQATIYIPPSAGTRTERERMALSRAQAKAFALAREEELTTPSA